MAEVSEDMRDAEECELCEENQLSLLSWCSGCEMVLCETCWMDQPIHRKKLKFSNATKHEKTDLRVAALIRSILNGGRQATTIDAHEYNLSTKWFGVTTDNESSEKATFYSFDRFRSLLVYDTQVENAYQFPSITSFIGDTGAGKSTLINALMKV